MGWQRRPLLLRGQRDRNAPDLGPGIVTTINAELGREYYSAGVNANLGFSSDTYWDVGIAFAYKAVTLDLRYWDTNINAPTGAFASQCLNAGAGNLLQLALCRHSEVRHDAAGA